MAPEPSSAPGRHGKGGGHVDTPGHDLLRVGIAKGVPSNVVPEAHLLERIVIPDDSWAKEVVAMAIAMLPEKHVTLVFVPHP